MNKYPVARSEPREGIVSTLAKYLPFACGDVRSTGRLDAHGLTRADGHKVDELEEVGAAFGEAIEPLDDFA